MSYNKDTDLYEGYIYLITNNIDNKKYIGQTTRTIESRLHDHLESVMYSLDCYQLHLSMRLYGIDKFNIEQIEMVTANTFDELIYILNLLEVKYVEEYDSYIPNGYNMTKGGYNTSYKNSKKVDQYTLSGDFIKTFDSMTDAAQSINVTFPCIRRCCIGKQISSGGYIWRFHDEKFDSVRIDSYITKKIDMYSYRGKFIKTYNSITEAVREMNLPNSARENISSCCIGKISSCCNYVWRYNGDPYDKYPVSNRRINVKINCYGKDNIFYKTFNDLSEVFTFLTNEKKLQKSERQIVGNISSCLHHKNITGYGYRWFYADDPTKPDKTKIIS